MKTYYIYHIPGIKIGCTTNIKKRMRQQGFENWEILEEHNDGWLAGDRELELQKEYGYSIDNCHYMITMSNNFKTGRTVINNWQRKLTIEDAQVIKYRYKTEKISQRQLAKEYNVYHRVIGLIVRNKTYINS